MRIFKQRSSNSKLSLERYLMIILLGLGTSQLVVILGIRIFELSENLGSIKFVAMVISAGTQYFGNTFFGSKKL